MRMFDFTPPIELHKDLNPKLWEDGKLRPEVREALVKISKVFYTFLETDATLVDVIISGSQVNFNYTEKSDLDLHLIIPFQNVRCDLPVKEYFETKRRLWNEQHNITIRGIEVELYTEDISEPAVSSVYSIMSNNWIKPPVKPKNDYDIKGVGNEVLRWNKMIDQAVSSNNLDVLSKVKEMLVQYRKEGLRKEGEYGIQNLVFKSLRNSNKVKLLMAAIRNIEDKSLSI